jgi:hypothetical protein
VLAVARRFGHLLKRWHCYRNFGQIRYFKPPDGGFTDNIGLSWPPDRPRYARQCRSGLLKSRRRKTRRLNRRVLGLFDFRKA